MNTANQKNLISIGNFSKQTGANIKQLRYYDEIGILPPAYIEPQTKYRFYSFEQIPVVDVIQLCVGLGIPLQEMKRFVNDKNEIDYYGLIQYGKSLTQRKIKELEHKYNVLSNFNNGILRAESYGGEIKSFSLPQKYCYVIPYEGNLTDSDYYSTLKKCFSEMTAKGLKTGCEAGILHIYKQPIIERYL